MSNAPTDPRPAAPALRAVETGPDRAPQPSPPRSRPLAAAKARRAVAAASRWPAAPKAAPKPAAVSRPVAPGRPGRPVPLPPLRDRCELPARGAAAARRQRLLPLCPRRRPVPFRDRLLGPLRGDGHRRRRRPARRADPGRQRLGLGHRHPVRLHPQPGDRRGGRRAARPARPSTTARRRATSSSPSARTPRSRRCSRYWNRMVQVDLESHAGIIHVRANAFTPEDATAIASAILAESSALVNRLSDQAREDAVRFAREELAEAEDNLRDLRAKLADFRRANRLVDPAADVAGQMGLSERAAGRARQGDGRARPAPELRRPGRPAGDPGRAADQRHQRRASTPSAARSASRGAEPALADVVGTYEELKVDLEFASAAYTQALAALTAARAEARRQSRYLAPHVAADDGRAGALPAPRHALGPAAPVPDPRLGHPDARLLQRPGQPVSRRPGAPRAGRGMIEFRHVSKAYRDPRASPRWCSTTSAWRCPRARRSGCSAATAPASRRCSAWSRAPCSPTPARSAGTPRSPGRSASPAASTPT